MAVVELSKNGQPIKNGTCLVNLPKTYPSGSTNTINDYVINLPVKSTIDTKYDTRFDDPGYYNCCPS